MLLAKEVSETDTLVELVIESEIGPGSQCPVMLASSVRPSRTMNLGCSLFVAAVLAEGQHTMDQDLLMDGPADRMRMTEPSSALASVGLDIIDAFVFQRIAPGRFAHLGGVGRGVGWAGIVDVALRDEPLVAEALDSMQPRPFSTSEPRRVFGPYWASDGYVVPLTFDQFVVLGLTAAPAEGTDAAALQAAALLVEIIPSVSPAKRLADELELQHAVEAVMRVDLRDVASTAEHIVAAAVEALSCDYGALWDGESGTLATVAPSWSPRASIADVRHTMARMVTHDIPRCWQDVTVAPTSPPFTAADGVRSVYVLRVGDAGVLFLAHTAASPRGFTSLCQRIGERIAQAAGMMLSAAAHREQLRRETDAARLSARTDALTGLGNRLAWREALADSFAHHDRVGILVLDLDGLKLANDEHGHAVGDRLLVRTAAVLSEVTRDEDVVARVGGDEFGVLLPGADDDGCQGLVERFRAAASRAACPVPLSVAAGWAIARSPAELSLAERLADERMYADKRRRRSAHDRV